MGGERSNKNLVTVLGSLEEKLSLKLNETTSPIENDEVRDAESVKGEGGRRT